MIIYISHSSNFDFKNKLYIPLRKAILMQEYHFVLPHEEDEVQFPTKDFFESGQVDLVIAEVSYPSTGQGIELGWADALHIPVVCMYKLGNNISKALYTVSNKFVEYLDTEDMLNKLKTVIQHYEQTKN